MRGFLRTTVLAVAVLTVGICCQAGQTISVEARGISVAGPGYGDFMDGVQPFHNNGGTRVALMLLAPDGGLLSFNENASKVSTFQDDKGKNLLLTKQKTFRGPGFSAFPKISKDTKACILEVHSPEVPTKGAVEITLVGEAVMLTATQKQDFPVENVALKSGTIFKGGELNFEIKKCAKSEFDPKFPLEIEFAFKQDTTTLVGLKFFDAAGAEVACQRGGSSRMSFGNNINETVTFRLKQALPAASKIVVTTWMDMKEVRIPVSVKVGPGL